MNCPTCKSEMKPLFVGFFCPRDCDRKSAGSSGKPGEWVEFNHRGKRWRARKVKKIPGGTRSWVVFDPDPNVGHEYGTNWGEFVRDPGRFASEHWWEKPGDPYRDPKETEDDYRWFLEFEEIK